MSEAPVDPVAFRRFRQQLSVRAQRLLLTLIRSCAPRDAKRKKENPCASIAFAAKSLVNVSALSRRAFGRRVKTGRGVRARSIKPLERGRRVCGRRGRLCPFNREKERCEGVPRVCAEPRR